MKKKINYIFILFVLLAMVVNLIGNSGNVYSNSSQSLNTSTIEFIAKSACPDNLLGRDVDPSIVPVSPFRILPNSNNHLVGSSSFICHLPSVYRNVMIFDIDNLSTLGRKQQHYYVFTLKKIRI